MDTESVQQEVEAKVRKYICDNYLPRGAEANLCLDENLFDSGILDSAGLISFIVFLEKSFGLTIPDEDLLPENFCSLEAMTGYLVGKMGSVLVRE
jgi:acyl carrier protein